jgi:hypothetical protein
MSSMEAPAGGGGTGQGAASVLRVVMQLPLPIRGGALGAGSAGIAGGVIGLVVGLLTYAPTAPFAVLELGFPASVVGGIVGVATGAVVLGLQRTRSSRLATRTRATERPPAAASAVPAPGRGRSEPPGSPLRRPRPRR